jgi:3-dehydroquinate synthase class II
MDPRTEVLGTLALNAPVSIRTVLQGDSSLLAARIMVSERTAGMGSVRGVIASFGDGFFMVGAVKVAINAQTVIVSKGGTLSFADLKVGDQVAAVGSKQTDGSLLAAKVEVSRPQPVPGNVKGTIASIGNSFFMVGAIQVSVGAQTVIVSKGRTLSFSDLKVGDQVYAAGTKQADGSLLAAKIEVYTPAPVISTVRGAISGIGNGFFMVGTVKVSVSPQTVIVSKGKTLSFADLKVGDQVAAVGSKQPDGSLAANKIEVAAPVPVVSTVQGTITSLGNSFFMMGSVQVHVSSQTVIVSQGKVLTFAALKVGDQIFAAGNKQADGSLLALKIEVAVPKR